MPRVEADSLIPSRSAMKVVWILLCVTGCATQIVLLAMGYLSYDISTTVTYAFEDKMKLPSLTLCVNILEQVDWNDEKMQSMCDRIIGWADCVNQTAEQITDYVRKDINQEQKQWITFKLLDMFTIRELISMTGHIDTLFLGHLRYNPETEGLDKIIGFDETFNVTEFLMGPRKCFTLSFQKEYATADYLKLKQQFTTPGGMTVFARYESTETSSSHSVIMVMYTPAGVTVRGSNGDPVISPTRGISSSTYSITRSKILEAPFATNCIDYQKVYGVADRGECYESCIVGENIRRLGRKPLGARMEERDGDMKCMSDQFVKENKKVVQKISRFCGHQCSRHDCQQTIYTSFMKSFADVSNPNHVAAHIFQVPNTPTVTSGCMAKVTLAEFATDVASTLGFWFGLSVLSILSWSEGIIRRLGGKHGTGQRYARKNRISHRVPADRIFPRNFRIRKSDTPLFTKVGKRNPCREFLATRP